MKTLLLAIIAFSTTALSAQKKAGDVAKLDNETYDLGKVEQGVPATATFTVTNIGTEPLMIENASPSCGCTVSDFTKTEIAPGKTGYIKATFNAATLGMINKSVTVKFVGIDDVKSIKLTGEVLDKDAYAKSMAEQKTKVKTDASGTTKVKVKKSS
ncbi:DUF1573 domain-containing protein [soil metagenome]